MLLKIVKVASDRRFTKPSVPFAQFLLPISTCRAPAALADPVRSLDRSESERTLHNRRRPPALHCMRTSFRFCKTYSSFLDRSLTLKRVFGIFSFTYKTISSTRDLVAVLSSLNAGLPSVRCSRHDFQGTKIYSNL